MINITENSVQELVASYETSVAEFSKKLKIFIEADKKHRDAVEGFDNYFANYEEKCQMHINSLTRSIINDNEKLTAVNTRITEINSENLKTKKSNAELYDCQFNKSEIEKTLNEENVELNFYNQKLVSKPDAIMLYNSKINTLKIDAGQALDELNNTKKQILTLRKKLNEFKQDIYLKSNPLPFENNLKVEKEQTA